MKPQPLLIILLVVFQISCQNQSEDLIKMEAEEFIERVVNNNMPNPEEVKIFDEEGNEISLDSLKKLELTDEYFEDFYKDKTGKVQKVVVRKKTEEDDKLIRKIARIMQEKNSPEVKMVEVDCNKKEEILQRVYERDQEMRINSGQVDPAIDHENLEIVVSFLEKCGMPTLEDVNEVQVAAIWAVLQHSSNKWRNKYFPVLEEAADRGDLRKEHLALMKDRILVNEGKPQIYGSQMANGALEPLFEPEYVNQRRAEMGMEPIEDYLARFGIDFNIEQKTK